MYDIECTMFVYVYTCAGSLRLVCVYDPLCTALGKLVMALAPSCSHCGYVRILFPSNLCSVCVCVCVCVCVQVGSEVHQRKKVELDRLFTTLDNYMGYSTYCTYMYVTFFCKVATKCIGKDK